MCGFYRQYGNITNIYLVIPLNSDLIVKNQTANSITKGQEKKFWVSDIYIDVYKYTY